MKGRKGKERGQQSKPGKSFCWSAKFQGVWKSGNPGETLIWRVGEKTHLKSILDGRDESGAGGTSTGACGRQIWTAPCKGDRPQSSPTLQKSQKWSQRVDAEEPYQKKDQWKEGAILSNFPSKGEKMGGGGGNLLSSVWINYPVFTE